jgi:hypothetical protein
LYNSMCKSHLNYCITLWGSACSSYILPITTLQNKFLKSVLFLPKRTNTIALYKLAMQLNLSKLYKLAVLTIIYKVIYSPLSTPTPTINLFTLVAASHAHRTRSAHDSNLFIKHSITSTRHNSISIQGPLLWNSLPSEIKNNLSTTYKRTIKEHLLSQ